MQKRYGLGRRSTFLLVTALVSACAIIATAYTLLRLRDEVIDRNREIASMYARAFEDHLTQSFNVIDLTLANVAADRQGRVELGALLRHATYLRSVAILNERGVVVDSTTPENIGVAIARGDFLPPLPQRRAILRAGPPWAGRDFHDGRPASADHPAPPDAQGLLPILRDVVLAGGQWLTVLASVNADYFLNFYGRSLPAEAGVVELLRYDGTLLLSSDVRRAPGIRSGSDAVLERVGNQEFGDFIETRADGRAMLTAYRASRAYPFIVAVYLDEAVALASWRREATRNTVVVLVVMAAALALASFYFVGLERVARQHDADLQLLRLRGAALEAADNAIIITDRQGVIEWANPAFAAISGYPLAEVIGRNPRDLIKSGVQSAATYRELWNTILAGRVWRGEMINRRKDGSLYPEDQTITPVRDAQGAVQYFIAVKQDITERKRHEQRVVELSRDLVVVQESARRRLSGELHDRTSPNLAAINLNLDIVTALLDGAAPVPKLTARLDDLRALVEDTASSIREISSELRPPVLDHAGLTEAIETYLRQFYRRTSIEVRFECAAAIERFAPPIESALYRIVQEALTNCAKHSRASSIILTLQVEAQRVVLTVSDNGCGFDPAGLGKTTHSSGLGTLTMREMIELIGGEFSIDSVPGEGTRVRAVVLLEGDAA
jgi:PAS domain S-box-containing protein